MKPGITIVGLGAGDPGHLTMAGWHAISTARRLFLRTRTHPTVGFLEQEGLRFQSFDHLYESAESFQQLYPEIAGTILKEAQQELVTFAVPGHPLVGEKSVELIIEGAKKFGLEVKVVPGVSFLEAMYTVLGCDPADGLVILDGLSISANDLVVRHGTVITQMYSPLIASEVKLTLMERYPDEHEVVVIRAAGVSGEEKIAGVPLYEIDRLSWVDHLTSLYVPPLSVKVPEIKYPLDPLIDVMKKLLGPDGCPWDREQTHTTLKPYLLEEAYEVLEAIDEGDGRKLQEELGDVLLQVVFHGLLAEEQGHFEISDIVKTITEKMIRRHPHVFADTQVANSREVVENWEAIKAQEKGVKEKVESILSNITTGLPSLLRADKVQKRVARVGFDWPDWEGPKAKVMEEWGELLEVVPNGNQAQVSNELGDLLFAVVNVARFFKVNPEEALQRSVDKFIRRFQYIEKCCQRDEKQLEQCSLEELDAYWNEAKVCE